MLEDCRSKQLNIIITKSISKFGRDTVETLEALRELKNLGVRVIFQQENLDTNDTGSELMISVIECLAQAENESRSENIRWGIKQEAAQGTSKLYNKKCYGYDNDEDGKLIINEDESAVVRLIFTWYLNGESIIGILKELENRNIKSPTGKDKWPKHTIEVMLSNEKYKGSVRLLDSVNGDIEYLAEENNPPIVSDEAFDMVQKEKAKRSNVIKSDAGSVRKSSKYSSKNKK